MHLTASHEFDADPERVLESLLRPDYATFLSDRHPFFEDVRVLSCRQEQGCAERRVRYRARAVLPRIGPFAIPEDWLVWTEVSVLDLRTRVLTFENVPELASVRPKVVNRGTMVYRSLPGKRCLRDASFEIDFRVAAIFRPLAEVAKQRVGRQVLKALDDEADVLRRWVASPSA